MRRGLELLLAAVVGGVVVWIVLGLTRGERAAKEIERPSAVRAADEPAKDEGLAEGRGRAERTAKGEVTERPRPEAVPTPSDPPVTGTTPAEPAVPAQGAAEGRVLERPVAAHEAAAVEPAPEKTDEGTAVRGASGVVGVVHLAGEAPPPERVDTTRDPKCAEVAPKLVLADVEANAGRLAGVFVYVSAGLPEGRTYPAPSSPVLLDQRGCTFHPRVLGVQVDQPFEIVNGDPTLHNVHAFAKPGEFNQAMPKQGQRITKRFKAEQVLVPVGCDVHPWMKAWVGVVSHPFFAVTSPDGRFAIPDLPVGKYQLALVHPKLGRKEIEIAVAAGAATPVEVTF